jgi:hypothetical protein
MWKRNEREKERKRKKNGISSSTTCIAQPNRTTAQKTQHSLFVVHGQKPQPQKTLNFLSTTHATTTRN